MAGFPHLRSPAVQASDKQVRRLFKALAQGRSLRRAAMSADLSENTARDYAASGQLPSERQVERTWRTHADAFEGDWPEIERRLAAAPTLRANTIFDDLVARLPGRYEPGQLRTLQRRVRSWRARSGPEKEIFFAQEHRPGEALQLDFTWASEFCVTLRGEPYPHMLCHAVLPYSNWGWATPCRSESLAALSEGLQEALWELGGSPGASQTDNSTAATHDLRSGKRAFNAGYAALVAYYGMTPRTTGIGEKEQNGDVEAMNGALKRDLEQQLLLRGSRDFADLAAYRGWLCDVLRRRNATRGERLARERALLRPLPCRRLPAYRELICRVGQGTTIRAMGHAYSVPPRLVGERVRVRVHETRVEVLFADGVELDVERGRGKNGARIDYRHVIGSLVRKPGAFRCYRFREALFPTEAFRRAYARMTRDLSAWAADVEYLRIVHLAARTLEASVEEALLEALGRDETPRLDRVRAHVEPPPALPAMEAPRVDLAEYDALLAGEERAAS
jgi:hypothetical protein